MNNQEREFFSVPPEHSLQIQDGRHAKGVGYENYYQIDGSGNVINVWQRQKVDDAILEDSPSWKLLS